MSETPPEIPRRPADTIIIKRSWLLLFGGILLSCSFGFFAAAMLFLVVHTLAPAPVVFVLPTATPNAIGYYSDTTATPALVGDNANPEPPTSQPTANPTYGRLRSVTLKAATATPTKRAKATATPTSTSRYSTAPQPTIAIESTATVVTSLGSTAPVNTSVLPTPTPIASPTPTITPTLTSIPTAAPTSTQTPDPTVMPTPVPITYIGSQTPPNLPIPTATPFPPPPTITPTPGPGTPISTPRPR